MMGTIKKVEPNKWYSVKVKPPKERKWYLCQFESDSMEVAEWTDEYEGDGCFMWECDEFILGNMVAWRELPEKYKGK